MKHNLAMFYLYIDKWIKTLKHHCHLVTARSLKGILPFVGNSCVCLCMENYLKCWNVTVNKRFELDDNLPSRYSFSPLVSASHHPIICTDLIETQVTLNERVQPLFLTSIGTRKTNIADLCYSPPFNVVMQYLSSTFPKMVIMLF